MVVPQRKNEILIGTSGFSYPDWVGIFYPPDLPKKEWLEYYAKHFNFCELNFSYYRMPQEQQLEKYLEYDLQFAVKGHRSLTHDRVDTIQARQDFVGAVNILNQDQHLATVLLQFPYSFKYTIENRKYLLKLLEDLSVLPLVVEFRHPGWIKDSVFDTLKQLECGISMLDSPSIKGGMPQYDAVTSEVGYLRFHGQNHEDWWTGNNVSRYDYEYSQSELEAWIPRISKMAKLSKTSYIAFNNHARGQAISNAKQLITLLEKK